MGGVVLLQPRSSVAPSVSLASSSTCASTSLVSALFLPAALREFPSVSFVRTSLFRGSALAVHSRCGRLAPSARAPFWRFYRHRPNHALQRTEAGGGLFSVYHVLLRQPLSLSLDSLGAQMPFSVSRASRCQSRRFVFAVACARLWLCVLPVLVPLSRVRRGRAVAVHARLRPAVVVPRPASTPRFPVFPSGTSVCVGPSARGRKVAPNHALQRTGHGGTSVLVVSSCVAMARR